MYIHWDMALTEELPAWREPVVDLGDEQLVVLHVLEHLDAHDPVEGAYVLLWQVERVDVPGNYTHVPETFLLDTCEIFSLLSSVFVIFTDPFDLIPPVRSCSQLISSCSHFVAIRYVSALYVEQKKERTWRYMTG